MRSREHIFYSIKDLSMEEKASMLRDCKEISYDWRADILDCSFSIRRQRLNCTFEKILSYLDEDTRVVVIDRGKWNSPLGEDREHFEIGFRTMTSFPDYFLFIQVDTDKMPLILEKYRLVPVDY